jgi:hypothetical protein
VRVPVLVPVSAPASPGVVVDGADVSGAAPAGWLARPENEMTATAATAAPAAAAIASFQRFVMGSSSIGWRTCV